MSEIMEETVLLILNDLKADMQKLKEENQELENKLADYANKFSVYTKEQTCLLFKIQQVKQKLNNMNICKSGYNKFNNYYYYELEDINKPITDTLLENGLASFFNFKNGWGYLQIIDKETGSWMQWSTPLNKSDRYMQQYSNKSGKKGDVGDLMKDEQALQTYARRALYLQALEIAEPNSIEQEVSTNTGKKNGKVTTNELIVPEDIDDVTKSIFQQIKKDFGTKVQFNKTTLTNKLKSMKKYKKIDDEMYSKCLQIVEKM